MQMLFRVVAALSVFLASSQASSPLFVAKDLNYTNKVVGLYAINDAGDVLVSVPAGDLPSPWGEIPALIRDGRAISLVPTGTPNLNGVMVSGISERRPDQGVYVAGTAVMKDGFWRAALWNIGADGSVLSFRTMPNIILPPDSSAPGEQRKSYGLAVTSTGVLVGSGVSYLAGLATIWRPPYQTAVRYLLSTGSEFTSIREDELLVANGVEFDHGSAANRLAAAVMFEGGVPSQVPLLPGTSSTLWPNRIESMRGEWVAGYNHLEVGTRAFAWKIGRTASIELPFPPAEPGKENRDSRVWSINSSGDAVGHVNGGTPVYWHFSNGAYQAWHFSDMLPDEPSANYMVEDRILNNNAGEVVFLERDWNGRHLKHFQPLTNGVVALSAGGGWAEEGQEIEFKVKLIRAAGNQGPVSVSYRTIDDTAKSPMDYASQSGTITWNATEAGEKTIRISSKDNHVYSGDRSFKVQLSGVIGAQLGSAREGVGYIHEPTQEFVVRNQVNVGGWTEGCAVLQGQKQAVIKLERTGGSDGSVTFTNFQAFGFNASEGVDYEIPEGLMVSWEPGDTAVKSIHIPLLNTEQTITEGKSFWLTGTGKFEGTGLEPSFTVAVYIQPKVEDAQPVIAFKGLEDLVQSLALTIKTMQGTTVSLEKALGTFGNWGSVAQARSEDGEVQLEVPINANESSAFFRVRVQK